MSAVQAQLDKADLSMWEAYGIAVAAVGFGLYTAWIMADFVPHWLVFSVVVVITAWRLLSIDDNSGRYAYGCYTMAALLVLSPLLLIAPGVLSAGDMGVSWWTMVWMEINLVLVVVFLIPAAVFAYLGARYDDRWEIA